MRNRRSSSVRRTPETGSAAGSVATSTACKPAAICANCPTSCGRIGSNWASRRILRGMVSPSMRIIMNPSPRPSSSASVYTTSATGAPAVRKARTSAASSANAKVRTARTPPGERRKISGQRAFAPIASNDQVSSVAPAERRLRCSIRSAAGKALQAAFCSASRKSSVESVMVSATQRGAHHG